MAKLKFYDVFLDSIAPHLSQLSKCGAEPLPERENLIAPFVAYTLLARRGVEVNRMRKLTLGLIRRVEHAALAYEAGRAAILDFLNTSEPLRVSAYFGAVTHFETHVTQLNLARWLAHPIVHPEKKDQLYTKGSRCPDEQLQELHIQTKHLHDKITAGEVPEGYTVSIWLTNEGLQSVDWKVSFSDLVELWTHCYGVGQRMTQAAGSAQKKPGRG